MEMKRGKVPAGEKDGSGKFPAKEANSDMIIQPDEEACLEPWSRGIFYHLPRRAKRSGTIIKPFDSYNHFS